MHTAYLECIFNLSSYKTTVDTCAKILKEVKRDTPIDSIAFSGSSGAAMAYPLSYLLDLKLLSVRKKNDESHFSALFKNETFEGVTDSKNYVVVDDCCDTGKTLVRISKEINDFYKKKLISPPNLQGIMLYNHNNGSIVFYTLSEFSKFHGITF